MRFYSFKNFYFPFFAKQHIAIKDATRYTIAIIFGHFQFLHLPSRRLPILLKSGTVQKLFRKISVYTVKKVCMYLYFFFTFTRLQYQLFCAMQKSFLAIMLAWVFLCLFKKDLFFSRSKIFLGLLTQNPYISSLFCKPCGGAETP